MKKIWMLALVASLSVQNAYAECQSFANPEVLNSTMIGHLDAQANQKKQRIAVLPFADLSPPHPDPLLGQVLAYAFYDLFSPHLKGLLHPYVSFAKTGDAPKTEQSDVRQTAKTLMARYVLFGTYQIQNDSQVRVLIGGFDSQKNAFLSPQVAFTSNLDDSLIDLFEKHTHKALKSMRVSTIKHEQRKLPGLKAYRYYAKGMNHARFYDAGRLNVAQAWLEKAIRESHHDFDEAVLAEARGRFMLALLQKLNRENFTETFHAGMAVLAHLKNKSPTPKFKFTERFLRAHELYQKGLIHLSSGQHKLARDHAANGLSFVPEDGMLENIVEMAGQKLKKNPAVTLKQPICF